MLLPDVTDTGRIVFVDYRPGHPRYAMLQLAARGTCLIEVRRTDPLTGKGHRFETVITGLDTDVVDSQLRADLVEARRAAENFASAYMREVRRLDIARRLLADVDEGCTIIRADYDKYRLQRLMPTFDEVR